MNSSLFNRLDYPTLDGCNYLNQASLGLIGQPAVKAMHKFIDDFARHGNCYLSDEDEIAFLNSLRSVAAKLFVSPESHIAIVASASEILAQLPMMLLPGAGGFILAVSSDFPAVTRPWLRQQIDQNCQIRFVEDSQSEDLTDGLIAAIDESTSVVTVSSVQYATGTRVDINRLRETTARAGARLIVDVTQEAGASSINASTWDADAVVSSGYKWLGGHGGVALAVMSPRLLDIVPPMPGWMGAPDPFSFDATSILLASDARRYTQSTMSYASVACLTTAIEQLLALGTEKIEAHARKLATLLIEGARQHGWHPFRALSDSAASSHIIALSHQDKSSEEAVKMLVSRNIFCSSRNGRIRVSLAPYNDESDINALVRVLGSL